MIMYKIYLYFLISFLFSGNNLNPFLRFSIFPLPKSTYPSSLLLSEISFSKSRVSDFELFVFPRPMFSKLDHASSHISFIILPLCLQLHGYLCTMVSISLNSALVFFSFWLWWWIYWLKLGLYFLRFSNVRSAISSEYRVKNLYYYAIEAV